MKILEIKVKYLVLISICIILLISLNYLLIYFSDYQQIVNTKMERLSPNDPSSYSRPDLVKVTQIKLHLEADFINKVFHGHVDLIIEKLDKTVDELVLDTRDLSIQSVILASSETILNYVVGDENGEFGSKLVIKIPNNIPRDIIRIKYATSPSASGLQWLGAEQTAGKIHPYVFSQFQAIHARSFLPCQDTPTVKTAYTAEITTQKELTVLMSAIIDKKNIVGEKIVHSFVQNVPIQSYLIAIAIGALESRKIGPRSTVWAEKEVINDAAYEFANTEKQLQTAEDICGPYVWGIYDLLVLPPSFPFGGMENPCLTFVTPTLLAGDRSLADVVAHEIAHSWTGNLVTNSNFEHFWLNEGFTVFIERKILGRLQGSEVQDFQAYGGTLELNETINRMGVTNPLTNLVVNLTGIHPDDAFSTVPYEKGHTFLRYLESVVSGPAIFEPFLRKYFDTYKYKSLSTDDFKNFFIQYFKDKKEIENIDWDTWLYKAGMPPIIPSYDQTLIKSIDALKKRWLDWNVLEDVPFEKSDFDSLKAIQFLQKLLEEDAQPIVKLEKFENKFKFINIQNSEIKFRWLSLGLKAKWEQVISPTINWLNEVGRMKFTRPLYRALYAWEHSRNIAIKNFETNKKYMMHVSAYTIGKDLHLV